VPELFEHPDDKTNQAGHVHFMIIARDESKCLVGRDFMGPASWVCEVDQAGSVPDFCPIVTSFSFRKRLLPANPQNPAGQVQIDGTTLQLHDQKVFTLPVINGPR
jgi:hypothetical protein